MSAMQQDTLSEHFNSGMAQAASALRDMARGTIEISVPTVSFLKRIAAANILVESADKRICSVAQRLEGEFNAHAVLILSESHSLAIVRQMIGDDTLDALNDIEQEALNEIGNIILNACIGTVADFLDGEFAISLPTARIGTGWGVLQFGPRADEQMVMLISIDFILAQQRIHGHVAILQDMTSEPYFMRKLENFLSTEAH